MLLGSKQPLQRNRSGAAAVEFAVVMNLVLVPLLIGLWEMGRLVQVQQIVANSAREGARMAAQSVTINQAGDPTQIRTTNTPGVASPSVKGAVMQYLAGAGLDRLRWEDVDVTFQFLNGNTAYTEPYQGDKGQRFRVTVTITDVDSGGNFKATRPLRDRCLWTALGLVRPTTVSFSSEWTMLVDDPFNVNTTMPSW
jgi:Flp pilus assembly protein TadG